jgi:hypothetical protein
MALHYLGKKHNNNHWFGIDNLADIHPEILDSAYVQPHAGKELPYYSAP